jgi:hypothetical protein
MKKEGTDFFNVDEEADEIEQELAGVGLLHVGEVAGVLFAEPSIPLHTWMDGPSSEWHHPCVSEGHGAMWRHAIHRPHSRPQLLHTRNQANH